MRIAGAESQIMEALWAKSPLSADELVSDVLSRQAWGAATVKTLINRLLKKGAIKSERIDGRHQYRPLVERAAWVDSESQGLLDRLFDGQVAPLISHFAERRKLSANDVARLKALIEELDDD
jgi:BlaI family penicillinase repressor